MIISNAPVTATAAVGTDRVGWSGGVGGGGGRTERGGVGLDGAGADIQITSGSHPDHIRITSGSHPDHIRIMGIIARGLVLRKAP